MMQVADTSRLLEVAVEATKLAGSFIKEYRAKGEIAVHYKGVRDLLTEADLGAERIILDRLRSAFPTHEILSEEASPDLVARLGELEHVWIVDPIDGTTNFAQGHPQVGISVAYAVRGQTHVGVVHAPFLNETFTAVRGLGAELNGKRIFASQETDLERSLVCTGFPYDRDHLGPILERLERVLRNCRDLRRLGAASLDLCFVACGRLEAYYETVRAWDMAAGALIAREAGAIVGRVSPATEHSPPPELDGEDLLAAAPNIYEKMVRLLSLATPLD